MPKPYFFISLLFLSLFAKSQTGGFTYQSSDGLYCSPVNVQFTHTATGNPTGFIWSFGNGQGSTAANPSVIYTAAGSYTVKLIVVYDNLAVESSQTIVINSGITATLTANRNYICTPGIINFSAGSNGNIAAYEWDFGDGTPLTTTSIPTIGHTFSVIGNYTVKVKLTDASGCSARSSYDVVYKKPPLATSILPTAGCIPALVNFSAVPDIPAGTTVTNYTWNFGDGSPVLNTASGNVSKTYTAVGSYVPSVSFTTNEGCSNSFTFDTIAYGIPPTNIAARPDKAVYCGSETPVFVAQATNANQYFWDYGDGTTALVFDTITSHNYATLGFKTVSVFPYFNGCIGSGTSFQIEIIGVIASFNFSNTCGSKQDFSFTNTSQGIISSYLWNFGDGSSTETTSNTSHSFGAGSFLVSLNITDSISGCSNLTSAIIYSGNSTLSNPDSSICRNTNTTFTLSNDQDNPAATYTWNVLGLNSGPAPDSVLSIDASILGNYPNNFVVINNGGSYCPDTVYLNKNILVRGPNLSFDAPATICLNNSYSITNTSAPFVPADSVVLWYWNYGINGSKDTVYQPAPFTFPGPATFSPKLVARDNKGCIDSLSKPVVVNPIPFVKIIPSRDTFCFGITDTLIAYHSDSLLWTSSGPIACTTCDTLIISPASTTQYVATANNTFNCSISDTANIIVYAPFTAAAVANPLLICAGESININAGPPDKRIVWSPTVGLSSANTYNPVASPFSTTTYLATLTDSAGCFSSTASVDVIVKTLPTVDAGADRTYPYNTPFTLAPLYSNNVRSYLWSPANTLSCANCATPNGTALEAQTYYIEVKSDSGCVAKDTINILIECKYANLLMPSAFTPNRDLQNDLYYPLARGISKIKRFAIFNRFGQLIFEVKNFKPNDKAWGWDGRFKGQDQSPDTYVYFLEAVCDVGGTIIKKDSFILLR
jgi:gliding motility-associated-like protein